MQRTTAISERRMGIVKRNQLGGEVHMRLDVLLTILIPDMLIMIEEYWNRLLNYSTTSIDNSNNDINIILDEQRLKPIEERWRQKVSKRGGGHYSKGPDEATITDLLSCLLASQDNLNENIKLPIINPNWLNVAIGILLSVGNNNTLRRTFTLPATNTSPLLDVISTFLEEWCCPSTNGSRSGIINFSLPNNQFNDILEQSIYILENILIPLLPCQLIVNKVYICKKCQSTIKIRCTITSIPVNVSRSGLHLERDLFDFFAPTSSDLLCSTCKTSTIRHIEVIQWPSVLLINVNDSIKNVKHRKPPGILSLAGLSSDLAIGCPSASIYDLICFNSIIQSGGNEAMVRITKVKKSWLTSVNKTVIGEGEQLQRLYAHSRILVFERIHRRNTFNFIRAIIKCTLTTSSITLDGIPACATLHEACSIIETNPALAELNNALVASIKTCFYCYSCHKTPDSLQTQSTQIFTFQLTPNNEIIASPVVFKVGNENNREEYCTYCDYSAKDIEMHVCKQVFIKCPSSIIRLADQNFEVNDLFNSSIKLTDVKNINHCYKPVAIMLISRYSDTASIIKQEAGDYIQYSGDNYSTSTPLSKSKMADLCDTCGSILVFYHQSRSAAIIPSQMQIISHTNVNGAQSLIIQSGDKFFSIKTAQSNTGTT